jgi:hypothetical protein
MQYETLYKNLIIEFRKRIPQNSKLVAKLTDILALEKEAVYRRLRQEVPFSFGEIVTIVKEMGISLDNIVGLDMLKRPPCLLQSVNYKDPDDTDYMMLKTYVDILKSMAFEPNGEMSLVTNLLPQPIYPGFEYVSLFYFFKWAYHSSNGQTKSYQEFHFSERMKEHIASIFAESRNVKTSYYILDKHVFNNFVDDVKYFHSIRLLAEEDVANIKVDLLHLIDYMEELAINGCFEDSKNKVFIYISDINIDTAYSYIDSQNAQFSMIWAFMLNGVSTYDENTLDTLKNWIQSIIRTSTLISVTGEKQRTWYFEKQREIANEL